MIFALVAKKVDIFGKIKTNTSTHVRTQVGVLRYTTKSGVQMDDGCFLPQTVILKTVFGARKKIINHARRKKTRTSCAHWSREKEEDKRGREQAEKERRSGGKTKERVGSGEEERKRGGEGEKRRRCARRGELEGKRWGGAQDARSGEDMSGRESGRGRRKGRSVKKSEG